MNKVIIYLFILLLIANCSLNSKSKFWTKESEIKVEVSSKIIDVFKKDKVYKKELNQDYKIKFSGKPNKNSFLYNFDNNNGRTD